jgi:serine/threonine protein kinase
MRLGHYEVLAGVGAGGMGEVYRARDTRLQRTVAIKVIAPDLASPQLVRRLEEEALAASALNHPNIVTVFEFSAQDEVQYLATEFVDGETLRSRLRKGAVSIPDALDIATQIASALEAAHAAGIVHRDVKPENVMLRPDGFVKVLDFGLAKLLPTMAKASDHSTVTVRTEPGTILGTYGYMPPEQIRGLPVDERADIWSLGVVLHEMVAGRSPFAGPTTSDVIASVLEHDPPSLASCGVDAPSELERIIGKSLAKDRESRYQNVKDVLIDLRRLRQHLDVQSELKRSSRPVAPPQASTGVAANTQRRAAIVSAILVVGVLLSVTGLTIWQGAGPGSSEGPVSSAPPRRVEYWLTVQKYRDGKPYQDPFESSGREIFEPGWKFRLNFSSPTPGFLYLLNQGPAPEGRQTLHMLFPTPSLNAGSAAVAAAQVFQTAEYRFDDNPGTERLWIVWGSRQVVELERAKEWVNPEHLGHVKDDVLAASILKLLEAHACKEEEVKRDKVTRRMVIEARSEVLTCLAELEHR